MRSGKPTSPASLRRALAVATDAVLRVAPQVVARHRRLRPADVRRKGEGDFVTAVDRRAEQWLRQRLGDGLPAAGFLGEESPGNGLEAELVWVVDPIDGTSNYARGLSHYAVSVALLARGQPVLGVLWCEPEGCLYTAVAGHGARRGGRRLRLPAGRWDDGTVIGCQWHRGQQQMGFLARLQQQGCRVRTFGCTVVQLADVVMGRLDANVQQQGHIWDLAAAGLLVVEAGGMFTDWLGRDVFPFRAIQAGHTPTIAAPPAVHRKILAITRSVRLG